MESERVHVRRVEGRYPHQPKPLRSGNIEVTVREIARVYEVRLDDSDNPEAWVQIVLEVSSDA